MDAKRSGGAKYWVAGKVNGRIISFFVDSGADVSIFLSNLLPNLQTEAVDEPFFLSDYRDKNPVKVNRQSKLSISFRPGALCANFFVSDTKHPIIGNDIL